MVEELEREVPGQGGDAIRLQAGEGLQRQLHEVSISQEDNALVVAAVLVLVFVLGQVRCAAHRAVAGPGGTEKECCCSSWNFLSQLAERAIKTLLLLLSL